jgi:hypothetical protein
MACVAVIGFIGLVLANRAFAPEMYTRAGVVEIAKAFASGRNYSVFDLNINIRELRDEHIKRMVHSPDVIVLGASHWQEAHDWLVQHKRFYNAHVHRDYYEDMLGVTEMFLRHDRLPKQMIIAIRDNLFTPIAARTDYLWLPGVPYYRAMAQRLDLKQHATWETLPWRRWRELVSVGMLYENVTRWANAVMRPQRTYESDHSSLDILLPGGSIVWSHEHRQLFTQARAAAMSDEFARARFNDPPKIDPKGVEAMEALFRFLKRQGVEVYLAHPPFNPEYYDKVMQGPYAAGLRRVEQLTLDLASKYDFDVIGSFDPSVLGCHKHMFIDAEHANSECLSRLFNQFTVLDKAKQQVREIGSTVVAASKLPVAHTVAMATTSVDLSGSLADYAAPEPLTADVEAAAGFAKTMAAVAADLNRMPHVGTTVPAAATTVSDVAVDAPGKNGHQAKVVIAKARASKAVFPARSVRTVRYPMKGKSTSVARVGAGTRSFDGSCGQDLLTQLHKFLSGL